jgi:hypothetical protein
MNEAGARASRWRRAIDPLIFTGLFAAYLAALIASAASIGYARDEGFYFHAASTYGKWFELLLSEPGRALQPSVVDRFWQENREHPALMKSLFWVSERLLAGSLFAEPGTALRLPAMALSALGVATTFALGRRCIGRAGGLFAALAFALMPSIFHHSHLACFDMPITALWLIVVYAYQRSLEPRAWGWSLACAVLYGLALDTKHNSWLLPPAILAHAAVLGLLRLAARRRRGASEPPAPGARHSVLVRALLTILLTMFVAPAVLYALWPWIWHDTVNRLVEYVEFHRQHVYYNIEYLGRTYFEPPFPRSYAWVMTAATVPLVTLVLAFGGALVSLWAAFRGAAPASALADAAVTDVAAANTAVADAPDAPYAARTWAPLWALCVLTSYFMWSLPDTPIFGGTKHWLTAYPFLALFAGYGFARLVSLVVAISAGRATLRAAAPWALAFCTLVGPLATTWHSVPWGLAAYMPIVGGAPGAATLGLNRSFWGYTTGSVTGYLNQNASRGDRVFLHDTALDSFRMLQRDGRLRRDVKPWGAVAGSKLALYHHEQHMSRVEFMIWVDYGTTVPAHVATYDGVPIIWVYRRP